MQSRTIYLAALLAVLVACNKDPQPSSEYSTDPDAVRIDASVGTITRSNPLGENQTSFNSGDKITVIHTTVNKLVNYVYDGTSWAPEGNDYLVWQTDAENTFTLRYPAGDDWGREYLSLDQSTIEEMSRSDRMIAGNVKFDKIPLDRQIKAELKRQRSLITVEIAGFNDEFSSEDAKITDLKLYLWDGSQGDEINPVIPYIRDEKGVHQPKGTAGLVGYNYTAIGRNDCDYRDKPFIKLTVAGKDLTVANPSAMDPGKHYTYHLTVGKNTVKLSGVTVEDWTSGTVDGTYETVTDRYSVWDGSVDTNLSDNGELYIIFNAAQLAGFAQLVNGGETFDGKTVELRANIDLNGLPWTPIGNNPNMFRGHFDGNGKVIINMTVAEDASYAGLFGTVYGATVSNIILRNGKVSGTGAYSALLVADGPNITIESCKVDGIVKSTYSFGYSGGLIGETYGKSKISNCEVNVDCYGEQYSGGIIGRGGNGSTLSAEVTIEGCIVRGQVSGKSKNVGGIAASLYGGNTVIFDCVSYADIKCSDTMDDSSMGGLVGQINGGMVKNCTVYGNIFSKPCSTGTFTKVGGMFGLVADVTMSGLKFEGLLNVDKGCSDLDKSKTGAFIGEIQNSITIEDKCTYRKSGNEKLPAVASNPNGVKITKIEAI